MTDPSYRGQILVFTQVCLRGRILPTFILYPTLRACRPSAIINFRQPLIGNYGVPSNKRDQFNLLNYFESPHIQCAGLVVADVATKYSHWTAVESLGEWCAREGVVRTSRELPALYMFAPGD